MRLIIVHVISAVSLINCCILDIGCCLLVFPLFGGWGKLIASCTPDLKYR